MRFSNQRKMRSTRPDMAIPCAQLRCRCDSIWGVEIILHGQIAGTIAGIRVSVARWPQTHMNVVDAGIVEDVALGNKTMLFVQSLRLQLRVESDGQVRG